MIKGLNGRTYDSSGKRIEAVQHEERRSRSELMAARAAAAPQQPGIPTGNPFEKTIQLELKRHNHLWQASIEGQRVLGNLRRASDEWTANEKAKQEQAEFAASISDLVRHAEKQVEAVMNDPTASVEDCETANAALAAVKATGDRESYIAWERKRHEQVTARLVTEAADYDSQARAAIEKRDAVLNSALEPTPVPNVKQSEPVMDVPIDRSKAIIVRKVNTPHGVRETSEVVDV